MTTNTEIGVGLTVLTLAIVMLTFYPWCVMIGLGILHAELLPVIPALGFGKSFLVAIAIFLLNPGSLNIKNSLQTENHRIQ